ncbi:MAG: AraC family transcriptional regulator, partial [Maribacter sp.]
RGTKFIGDYVSSYKAGELVLLNSNLPHCWKNENNLEAESASIVIQWNKEIFTSIPELAALQTMMQKASRGLLFKSETTASVVSNLKSLPKLKGAEQYLVLLSILLELSKAEYTSLSNAKFTKEIPWEHNNRMVIIHDFVSANYHKAIALKQVADMVNLSQQAFSRFFKKMMGRSFFVYLNEYRINQSAKMLIDSDMTVADIAYKCGFETLPFFFKKFKIQYGCTPNLYRKQHAIK